MIYISALHEFLDDQLQDGLADHSQTTCIMCNPQHALANGSDYTDEYIHEDKVSYNHIAIECSYT